MDQNPFDLEMVDLLLSTTRAVRRRLDLGRKVPREIFLDCIRLSQQAPTGSNEQSWRWFVLDDEEKRHAMSEIYAKGLPLLEEAAKAAKDPQTVRVYENARAFTRTIRDVPALVIPCVAGRLQQDAPTVISATYYASIYPAIWSFQLALRSRGLGSVLTTMHLAFEEESREVLGLPDEIEQVALLPVAYTTGLTFKSAKRPPPESVTHFNCWGE